ncbi:DUF74-family protein [Octadecabacter antarcticus 307]|uniref:UPF0145 protein OAN307_c15750 n=1 Tax=Octadecabacter antarcticus 307 TaxID=391626 RepID=M9R647_9RHOB|nr:heavy metal-binding domain-containing protein [Octadecabacter antarcticus]AGI67248.1 DUF74-family protein [Octadecabacter antarcticus 307]
MAKCTNCGKKISFGNAWADSLCPDCKLNSQRNNALLKGTDELLRNQKAKRQDEERAIKAEINAVLLTTETAPNLNITKRIEIVTAECAFGMNIFKDLFAGVRDIVGGRSDAVQRRMRDSRKTALYELKREAHMVGANAVVGVDLDYVELSAAGSMVMLVASGTAVIIEGTLD